MRAIVSSLLGLMLVACGGSGGNDGNGPPQDYIDYPPLWNDYVIGMGETINLAESVEIEFLAVEEDTRCPTGAQCMSEGNARVRLKCITPRGSSIIELNTSNALPTSALFDYYGALSAQAGTLSNSGCPRGSGADSGPRLRGHRVRHQERTPP